MAYATPEGIGCSRNNTGRAYLRGGIMHVRACSSAQDIAGKHPYECSAGSGNTAAIGMLNQGVPGPETWQRWQGKMRIGCKEAFSTFLKKQGDIYCVSNGKKFSGL
jgi:hypothetical protein